MANTRLTPPIGAFGRYKLKAPWTVNSNLNYRCVSYRRVEEIVKSGKDVYTVFYEPMGLTKEIAELDISVGVIFIGLLGLDGTRIYVPDTYIESYPDQSSVVYDYTVLAVDLGPQPSDMDLTALSSELKTVASKYTGIAEADIVIQAGSAQSKSVMSVESHITLIDARKAAIATLETSEEKIARLETSLNEERLLNAELLKQLEELTKP